MDRKKLAKQLRDEAAQLNAAADLLEGGGKPKRQMSEATRRKMAAAQKRRHAKAKAPAASK